MRNVVLVRGQGKPRHLRVAATGCCGAYRTGGWRGEVRERLNFQPDPTYRKESIL